MRRSRRYALTVLAGFALLSTGLVPAAIAQAQSVNRDFEDPDVERDVSRFERDGRAGVYDERYEIVDLLGLRPGMDVADIGAGTGFFSSSS